VGVGIEADVADGGAMGGRRVVRHGSTFARKRGRSHATAVVSYSGIIRAGQER
jgi:hypothetical protein